MSEHTPGPWFSIDDEIVSVNTDTHIASVALEDGINPTEWQANMHLIAAAPDLLATLKALVAVGCLGVIADVAAYQDAWDLVPVVIAKAEGR